MHKQPNPLYKNKGKDKDINSSQLLGSSPQLKNENLEHGFDSFDSLEGDEDLSKGKHVDMFGSELTGKTLKTQGNTKRTQLSVGRNCTQYEESKMALFDDRYEMSESMKTSTQRIQKMKKSKSSKTAKANPDQQYGTFSPREPDDLYEGLQRESVFF